MWPKQRMRRIIPRMSQPRLIEPLARKQKLLHEVRSVLRTRHLSLRTEEAYVQWIRRFILFHNKRHPAEMGESEIRQFISDLAVNARISASTQTVALSALLFLYRDVLKKELPYVSHIERAQQRKKLPLVFTRDEVRAVLRGMTGTHHLIASLLYGSGMRLMECLRLRVKDIDLGYNQIVVRDGKGEKDRITLLPASVKQSLARHLRKVKLLHEEDREAGFGEVYRGLRLALRPVVCSQQWLGDTSTALPWLRVREIQRPKYGFYLDHIVDAIATAAIGIGLAVAIHAARDRDSGSWSPICSSRSTSTGEHGLRALPPRLRLPGPTEIRRGPDPAQHRPRPPPRSRLQNPFELNMTVFDAIGLGIAAVMLVLLAGRAFGKSLRVGSPAGAAGFAARVDQLETAPAATRAPPEHQAGEPGLAVDADSVAALSLRFVEGRVGGREHLLVVETGALPPRLNPRPGGQPCPASGSLARLSAAVPP